jgi:hypothetical protein
MLPKGGALFKLISLGFESLYEWSLLSNDELIALPLRLLVRAIFKTSCGSSI